MNKSLLKNIISAACVTNVCNFYKYYGIIIYSSLPTLLGLCLTVFILKPAKSGPKIDIVLVMSLIVIG